MTYPKTKREAVERLINKVEDALDTGDVARAVGGPPDDCPLCQYSIRDSVVRTYDCTACNDDFGVDLGFDPARHSLRCLSTQFGGIRMEDYDDITNKQRRAFLTALLPVLKQMLADMEAKK